MTAVAAQPAPKFSPACVVSLLQRVTDDASAALGRKAMRLLDSFVDDIAQAAACESQVESPVADAEPEEEDEPL